MLDYVRIINFLLLLLNIINSHKQLVKYASQSLLTISGFT